MGGNSLCVHIHHAWESEPFLSACSSLIILRFVEHRSVPLDATNMYACWENKPEFLHSSHLDYLHTFPATWSRAKAFKKPFSTTTFSRKCENPCFSSVPLQSEPGLVKKTGESFGAGWQKSTTLKLKINTHFLLMCSRWRASGSGFA